MSKIYTEKIAGAETFPQKVRIGANRANPVRLGSNTRRSPKKSYHLVFLNHHHLRDFAFAPGTLPFTPLLITHGSHSPLRTKNASANAAAPKRSLTVSSTGSISKAASLSPCPYPFTCISHRRKLDNMKGLGVSFLGGNVMLVIDFVFPACGD